MLTEREAADAVGVSIASLVALTKNGWIERTFVDGKPAYQPAEVERFLRSRQIAADAAEGRRK